MFRERNGIFCLLLCLLGFGTAVRAEKLDELRRQAAVQRTFEAYSAVCRYCYSEGKSADILSIYADSIRMVGFHTKSSECFIEYYSWKSEAAFLEGDFKKGYALKRAAIALSERTKDRTYLAECAGDMGYYYNVDAQYDSARYYLKKGLLASEGMPALREGYRTMLTNYASSFLFEGHTDSALIYTKHAREVSEADRDTAMLIENLNQLGTIYRRQKRLSECLSYFGEAVRLCELQDNFRTAAYIYGNLATVYTEWNQQDMAEEMSKVAVEYARKIGDNQMTGICLSNLGIIQCHVDSSRQEGIDHLLEAVVLLRKVNNRRRLCEAYSFLANAFVQQGEEKRAADYLEKLEALTSEMRTDVEFYRYYRVKGVILQSQGRYAEAVAYYQKQVLMLQRGYYDTQDYEVYADLSECYHALHQEAKSRQYLQKAYALRDSTFLEENMSQLSYFSAKYGMKEKELMITRLEQAQLEERAKALERRIFLGIVISALLFVLFLLLYARQRQKVKIARLAQAAGEKEQQFLTLQKETERRLTQRYIEGLESERTRIATELHDDVCNSLLALSMDVRTSEVAASGRLDRQLDLLEKARQRVRHISHELMPPVFQYATLNEMLSDYVNHLHLPSGMSVTYVSTEGVDWTRLPQSLCFEFYRIVQEAVGNAVKYAEASLIQVSLTFGQGVASVQVVDNGHGFDVNRKSKGIGLRTIAQRVKAIGGSLILESSSGKGTLVKASVQVDTIEE